MYDTVFRGVPGLGENLVDLLLVDVQILSDGRGGIMILSSYGCASAREYKRRGSHCTQDCLSKSHLFSPIGDRL